MRRLDGGDDVVEPAQVSRRQQQVEVVARPLADSGVPPCLGRDALRDRHLDTQLVKHGHDAGQAGP
jgi:hypothetical protein